MVLRLVLHGNSRSVCVSISAVYARLDLDGEITEAFLNCPSKQKDDDHRIKRLEDGCVRAVAFFRIAPKISLPRDERNRSATCWERSVATEQGL